MSDELRAQETPDSPQPQEFTGDHIQRLLRNADRLSFGERPAGFILINRARLLADHGITQKDARLIDHWVRGAADARRAKAQRAHQATRHHRLGHSRGRAQVRRPRIEVTRREVANLVGIVLPPAGLVVAIILLWDRMVGPTELAILAVGYVLAGIGIT